MKRIVICIVILSLLMTGCRVQDDGAQIRNLEYVEDSVWFDTAVYSTFPQEGFNGSWGDWMADGVLYATADEIVIRENYVNTITKETYNSINKYRLKSDGSSELVASFDLNPFAYCSEDGTESWDLQDILVIDGDVYLMVNHNSYDGENTNNTFYTQKLDFDSGIPGTEIISEDLRTLYLDNIGDVYTAWTDGDRIMMLVHTNRNIIMTFNENFELIDEVAISGVNGLAAAYNSEEAVYLKVYDYMNLQSSMYRLDKDNYEVESMDDIVNDYYKYDWTFFGDSALAVGNYGVYKYNYDTNTVDKVLDFNDCNLFIDRTSFLSVVYCDGDTAILCGYSGGQETAGYKFYRFVRAESNPNVGKAILRLASLDGIYSAAVLEAICEFNEVSERAFIIVDERYDIDNYRNFDYSLSIGYLYDPELRDNEAETRALMNADNQLRVDMMAGIGPDILINSYAVSGINNSNCMIDLREYLLGDNNINPEDYLDIVFNGNEEIYQLPLAVSPICMYWLEDIDIEGNGTYGGITFEQYESLVDSECDGKDPLSYYRNQTDYFVEMFNYNYDAFVRDGEIDIDNDEFRTMAEFAASRNTEMDYDMFDNWEPYPIGRYYDREISNPDLNHYQAYGMPSAEGNMGIKLRCDLSVGISSSCPMVDDAVSFVKIVMNRCSSGIRLSDIRASLSEFINTENAYITRDMEYSMDITEYDLISDSYIDKYIDLLQNADGIYEYDANISIIMYEEIQAYFAGDKPLDEVIRIMENRCQTVLDEQG